MKYIDLFEYAKTLTLVRDMYTIALLRIMATESYITDKRMYSNLYHTRDADLLLDISVYEPPSITLSLLVYMYLARQDRRYTYNIH